MRKSVVVDYKSEPGGLCQMPVPVFADGRHGVSGYAKAADSMVPCDLAGDYGGEWSQCSGFTTELGVKQLRDCLGMATQTEAGYGPIWSRSA